jgi:uracil-DNA glycosylase
VAVDKATRDTPVAHDAAAVARLAAAAASMRECDARFSVCRACPRLVAWREQVAATRKPAFADQAYWGRPVPGSGADQPRVLIVGLAPSAHGGNRTGSNLLGDLTGEWLYAALRRTGLARPWTPGVAGDDALLVDTRIVPAVGCAPPANRPTPAERDTCRPWLSRELALAWPSVRAVVALGAFGWTALWPALRLAGITVPARPPAFGHGVRYRLPDGPLVLGCYHPSQQNTATGRLTAAMLDTILAAAGSA